MAAGRACEGRKACPCHSRIPFEDLRNGSRPYLFGGAQRPACRNCHIDTLWANFCQYKNSGPVCYDWDIDGLSREFVARCDKLQQRPPLAPMLRCLCISGCTALPCPPATLPVFSAVLSQKGLGGVQH